MPTYTFQCKKCQHEFDIIRSMSQASDPVKCVQCESDETERLLQPSGIVVNSGRLSKSRPPRTINGTGNGKITARIANYADRNTGQPLGSGRPEVIMG